MVLTVVFLPNFDQSYSRSSEQRGGNSATGRKLRGVGILIECHLNVMDIIEVIDNVCFRWIRRVTRVRSSLWINYDRGEVASEVSELSEEW